MLTDLRPARADDCLSDLTFDAWRAGELGVRETRAAEAHLAGCVRCRERQQELAAAAAEFLGRFPVLAPSPTSAGVPLSRGERRSTLRPALAAAALALAAGVLLFVGTRPDTAEQGEAGTRLKGSERLGFVVRRGERVFDGVNGERLRPGDQLRFVVTTRSPRHVAIFGYDAAGVASVYYPTSGAHARLVTAAEGAPLDGAVELDATLGRERLYGLFCENPFALEPVREKLQREHELTAAPGCKLDALDIVKEPGQ